MQLLYIVNIRLIIWSVELRFYECCHSCFLMIQPKDTLSYVCISECYYHTRKIISDWICLFESASFLHLELVQPNYSIHLLFWLLNLRTISHCFNSEASLQSSLRCRHILFKHPVYNYFFSVCMVHIWKCLWVWILKLRLYLCYHPCFWLQLLHMKMYNRNNIFSMLS